MRSDGAGGGKRPGHAGAGGGSEHRTRVGIERGGNGEVEGAEADDKGGSSRARHEARVGERSEQQRAHHAEAYSCRDVGSIILAGADPKTARAAQSGGAGRRVGRVAHFVDVPHSIRVETFTDKKERGSKVAAPEAVVEGKAAETDGQGRCGGLLRGRGVKA